MSREAYVPRLKNRVSLEVFPKEKGGLRGSHPRSRSNSLKNGRASQDSIGRAVALSRPLSPCLSGPPISLFPILPGFGLGSRREKRGKEREGSCSPASKRNWKPTRCLRRDTAEFAKGGTQFPQESAAADIRLRKLRKYCVVTNKNTYRAFAESALSQVRTPDDDDDVFLSTSMRRSRRAKIRQSSWRTTIFLRERPLIQRLLRERGRRP